MQPFKLLAAGLNYMLAHLAYLIIHFEVRMLWNPDWTVAAATDYFNDDYDDLAVDYGQQDTAMHDPESNYPYAEEDPLLEEFSVKDGLPFPLLNMTYIDKTTPRPCDKEVTLYSLNEGKLYNPNMRSGKPGVVNGRLVPCHESNCER